MLSKARINFFLGILIIMAVGLVACGDPTATTVPTTAATTVATTTAAATTTTAATTTAAVAAGTPAVTTTAGAQPTPTAPLPTQADTTAEAGRQVFARVCAGCHLGQGTQAGRAPVLAVSANAINADFVRNQVRNGGTRMPKIDDTKISNDELEKVIVYLKAIHK